jgi:hypothetical protein
MGYVANVAVDPIEKKPFFHVLPGSAALSFGMMGCDLHCAYCQNWLTSQALRDPAAEVLPQDRSPRDLVEHAVRTGSRSVVSTYNEPLITSEWAHAVFEEAKRAGLLTGYVSNGNATPEVLDYLRPLTDLYKVDLKGFEDRSYRTLGPCSPEAETWRIEDPRILGEVVTLSSQPRRPSGDRAHALAGPSRPLQPWRMTVPPTTRWWTRRAPRGRACAAEIGTEPTHYVLRESREGGILGGHALPRCGTTSCELGFGFWTTAPAESAPTARKSPVWDGPRSWSRTTMSFGPARRRGGARVTRRGPAGRRRRSRPRRFPGLFRPATSITHRAAVDESLHPGGPAGASPGRTCLRAWGWDARTEQEPRGSGSSAGPRWC